MKKSLLLFVILLKISSETKSQTTDTLCFPIPVIQKVLIDAKQSKVKDTLMAIYRSDIDILQGKINLMSEKDKNHEAIAAAYQGQVTVLTKDLKKARKATKLVALGGLALSGIITALFIFK